MKRQSSRRIIAGILLACFLAPAASAEPAPPSPVGSWSFHTGEMRNTCVLRGEMFVSRKPDKTLVCRFTADWSCERGMMKSVETAQTCVATQTANEVVITSRMEKITKSDPAEFMDYMRASYAPDHFKVKINARGDEMRGLFHSFGQAEVIFRKHHDLIG
jgi:hypothetical protein